MNLNSILKAVFFCTVLVTSFSCSNDDSNSDNENTTTLPIVLELSGLGITSEQTTFSVNGLNLQLTGGESLSNPDDGIGIYYPTGTSQPYLELDLSTVTGISKITIDMMNGCGGASCTKIELIDTEGAVIEELTGDQDIPTDRVDIVFDDITLPVNALRITSNESLIYSIVLE